MKSFLRRGILFALLGTMLAATVLSAGCARGPAPEKDPIVVIGIDSADWHWIDPLMEQGKMPHFQGLIERGLRADLQSFVPLEKSPVIWTSIATGKTPSKHGIGGFTRDKQHQKLTGSLARKATTWWEILGVMGRRQAVIGWWVTYPATAVNGVLISDYVQYYPSGSGKVVGSVYPDSVWAIVESSRVNPDSVRLEDLSRFIDVDIAREHGAAAEERVEELKWIWAADETFRRVARRLYRGGKWDNFTVYFRGLDPACHAFWTYFEPGHSSLHMQQWEIDMLKNVVPAYYQYVDELVGDVLSYVDPDARILVMSDHGFRGHRMVASGMTMGVNMHRKTGILLMAGPGIRPGGRLSSATVLDIMPTILALAGIPPAKDLDGQILLDAFTPKFRRKVERRMADQVDSYEPLVPPRSADAKAGREVDEEILRRLRSLGYID